MTRMPVEIERKFLVTGTDWQTAKKVHYCQGYLNNDINRTVRVRIAGNTAFLTIKGPSIGVSRAEFEYAIPLDHAEQLLKLCEGPLIEKNRHFINYDGLVWEVDEFLGENSGLVVAEIELKSDKQAFERPHWLGHEVTGDSRYFNSNLAVCPFQKWPSLS